MYPYVELEAWIHSMLVLADQSTQQLRRELTFTTVWTATVVVFAKKHQALLGPAQHSTECLSPSQACLLGLTGVKVVLQECPQACASR